MSGAKAVYYTVEQRAAMEEANSLAHERSRLSVALTELARLESEAAQFQQHYEERVSTPVAPVVSGRVTSAGLRTTVDRLERETNDSRIELASARDRQRRARLAQRLNALLEDHAAPPPLPGRSESAEQQSTPPRTAEARPEPSTVADRESAGSRTQRYLDQLETGVELSETFLELVGALLHDDAGDKAHLAADAIQAEVGRLNREEREHRRVGQALRDLQIRVGALASPPAGLDLAIASAEEAHARRQPVDLSPIAIAVAAAETEARQAQDAAYVLDVLGDILREQGYEPVGGFDTAVAENGLLVRKPSWAEHGVLMRVDDDEVNMVVVRTAETTDAVAGREHDVAAETQFCDDLPAVLEGFDEHGVTVGVRRSVPPNVIHVRTLEGATAAPSATEKRAKRRAKPKEMRL